MGRGGVGRAGGQETRKDRLTEKQTERDRD